MSGAPSWIDVEVVFAGPATAVCQTFRIASPATVADVLAMAATEGAFREALLDPAGIGIFGRLTVPQQRVEHGDRVEIYRPLAADPKQARRARARATAKPSVRGRTDPG